MATFDDVWFRCIECGVVRHEEEADQTRDWIEGTPCVSCVLDVESEVTPTPGWWVESEGDEG